MCPRRWKSTAPPSIFASPRAFRPEDSLPGHRDAKALLGRDQVIVILLLQVDLNPVDLAVELVVLRVVIGGDRRSGSLADVAGLIGREQHRHGLLHSALADLFAVHIE